MNVNENISNIGGKFHVSPHENIFTIAQNSFV